MTYQLCLPRPDVTIILHGWHWVSSWGDVADAPEGEEPARSQQHAHEMPHVTPDGWCVYTRHEGPTDWRNPSGFDLSNELDFHTYEEAVIEAQARAADYGIEHMED
ncbi:hypothetical protein [Tsuneonella sp. HG222]